MVGFIGRYKQTLLIWAIMLTIGAVYNCWIAGYLR